MAEREYDQQRARGAEQIEGKLRDLAKHEGVEIKFMRRDGGGPIMRHNEHDLVVSTSTKTQTAKFSDEQLADYPGRVGTAHTEAMLREIVRRLK